MVHFDLLSLRKCADKIGVSHAYLSKLKKEGYFREHPIPGKKRGGYRIDEIIEAMPNRREDKSDVNEDDIDLFCDEVAPHKSVADMTDEQRAERMKALAEAEEAKRYVQENSDGIIVGEDDDEISTIELVEARTRKEFWLARQAELKYKKEHGMLVDKSDVERDAFGVARMIRDKLMNIGDRIAPIIAAESDRFVCKQIIDDEIASVLNNLAGGDM